ncbi:hypothetical protein MRX96_031330 [Rhipicephalus microplus]
MQLYHRLNDCACRHLRNIVPIQKNGHQIFHSQYKRCQLLVLPAEDSKNSKDCAHRTRKLNKMTPSRPNQLRWRGRHLSSDEEEGAFHHTDMVASNNCSNVV